MSTIGSFRAFDGAVFETARACQSYTFEQLYTFRNCVGQKLVKEPGSIAGQPFELSELRDCEVQLLDHSEGVQADDLQDCNVLIGAADNSVFLRNCTGCR
jgi:Tubulin binding cofactor C